MPTKTRIVKPGSGREVFAEDGTKLSAPESWTLLKPGDAGATRRVKAAGPSWTVKAKKGRRIISLGVWADEKTIAKVTEDLIAERSTDAYAKRQKSAKSRRDRAQELYIEEFTEAVYTFLRFNVKHETLGAQLAQAVAVHATPVGSGTVARTKMIPVERRAEAAVIAWLRHQTTGYDEMVIPRVKGKRREVRRMLAEKSRLLLDVYRSGKSVPKNNCLIRKGLAQNTQTKIRGSKT